VDDVGSTLPGGKAMKCDTTAVADVWVSTACLPVSVLHCGYHFTCLAVKSVHSLS